MKKETRNQWIAYGIPTGIGSLLSVYVWTVNPLGVATPEGSAGLLRDRYRLLCDAFTFPGVLLLLFGVLLMLSSKGAFDGIGYAMKHAIAMLIPGKGAEKPESYFAYTERKREKRKTPAWRYCMLPGAGFLAVALVFLLLFYTA